MTLNISIERRRWRPKKKMKEKIKTKKIIQLTGNNNNKMKEKMIDPIC